jgi:NAD dependent epimerase/dehydratase family
MTVLVTGGAGYIGSHMVHALVDAGERVVVLDNLATRFDWAVAQGGSLVTSEINRRVAVLMPEHQVDAFRRLGRRAGLGSPSTRLLPQQYAELARSNRERRQGARAPFHLLFDRRGLRQPRPRRRCHGADIALSILKADDRDHLARFRQRPRPAPRDVALHQCRTSTDPLGRTGQSTKGATEASPGHGDHRHQGPKARNRGIGRATFFVRAGAAIAFA